MYARGQRLTVWPFLFVVEYRSGSTTRLGLSVSRKAGCAVVRNLLKRRVRDVFRRNHHGMPMGWQIVVMPKQSAAAIVYDHIVQAFGQLGKRLHADAGRDAKQGEGT